MTSQTPTCRYWIDSDGRVRRTRIGEVNQLRADIKMMAHWGAAGTLKHWAHYFDAPVGDDYRAFAVQRYMAAVEAVGALG